MPWYINAVRPGIIIVLAVQGVAPESPAQYISRDALRNLQNILYCALPYPRFRVGGALPIGF